MRGQGMAVRVLVMEGLGWKAGQSWVSMRWLSKRSWFRGWSTSPCCFLLVAGRAAGRHRVPHPLPSLASSLSELGPRAQGCTNSSEGIESPSTNDPVDRGAPSSSSTVHAPNPVATPVSAAEWRVHALTWRPASLSLPSQPLPETSVSFPFRK